MIPLYRLFLCAAVIVLMLTAGCIFSRDTSGAQQLVPTTAAAPAATPVPSAPVAAGTTQPGAAGTQGTSGTCTADINSDPANCGGCGYACPANAICQQGQCYCGEGYTASNNQCVAAPEGTGTGTGCPAGMSPCPDGYCYELASSPDNCGLCGNVCPAGMICSASTCANVPTEVTTEPTTGVTTTTTTSGGGSGSGGGISTTICRKGLSWCKGGCVNLSSSASHCGTCINSCVLTKFPACCGGKCVNIKTDSSNCGTCGHKCFLSTTCVSGSCKSKVIVTGAVKIPVTYAKIVNPDIIGPVGPIGP